MLQHQRKKLLSFIIYQPELALVASGISLLCFLVAFPVCYVQMTNVLKRKTTHERFAYKKNSPERVTNSSKSSMPSMTLLRSTGENNVEPGIINALLNKKKRKCCLGSDSNEKEMDAAD